MGVFGWPSDQGPRLNSCPACLGTGAKPACPMCEGTGRKVCTVCHGIIRRVPKARLSASVTCFGCADTGRMSCTCARCSACDGTGMIPRDRIAGYTNEASRVM
jgi:DnaJ-class molecular chaperone